MDNLTLKKLQDIELKILIDFDQYCKKHQIKYSLYAGTLLGAVRHGGFIPWDDDIDVCLTRSEYIKFCNLIKRDPISGYYFQNYTDDKFCLSCHGKLRKNNTLLLTKGDKENYGHQGIWLDIFPLDKLSYNKSLSTKTIRIAKRIIILTRANKRLTTDTRKKTLIKKTINLIPYKFRRKVLNNDFNKLAEINDSINKDYDYVTLSTVKNIYQYKFPQELLNGYTTITFEQHNFMVFKKYEKILTILFDDYMTLPPKSEQVCKHNIEKLLL